MSSLIQQEHCPPLVSLGKEVEHEAIAGLAWMQHLTGAGAPEVLEASVLQALIGGWLYVLASTLTQLL